MPDRRCLMVCTRCHPAGCKASPLRDVLENREIDDIATLADSAVMNMIQSEVKGYVGSHD